MFANAAISFVDRGLVSISFYHPATCAFLSKYGYLQFFSVKSSFAKEKADIPASCIHHLLFVFSKRDILPSRRSSGASILKSFAWTATGGGWDDSASIPHWQTSCIVCQNWVVPHQHLMQKLLLRYRKNGENTCGSTVSSHTVLLSVLSERTLFIMRYRYVA